MVLATIRSSGVAEHAVLDVAQVVWMKLFQHCERIREPAAVPGWLRTTSRNEAMYWHRTKRRHARVGLDGLPEVVDLDDGFEALETDDETTRRLAQVQAAMPQLEDRCRRLLAMKCQTPPASNERVARELNMAIGSVGPTYQRCLVKLRRLLEGARP